MENDLAVEVDEKGHTDRNLIFEKKRREALKKTIKIIKDGAKKREIISAQNKTY